MTSQLLFFVQRRQDYVNNYIDHRYASMVIMGSRSRLKKFRDEKITPTLKKLEDKSWEHINKDEVVRNNFSAYLLLIIICIEKNWQ